MKHTQPPVSGPVKVHLQEALSIKVGVRTSDDRANMYYEHNARKGMSVINKYRVDLLRGRCQI